MSKNEMEEEEEEQEASMFTDTELLDAVGVYKLEIRVVGRRGLFVVGGDDYEAVGIAKTAREAIANCVTGIKDEQGEKQ